MPPPIPDPRAVGCSRIWASRRSRSDQVEILMPTRKPRGRALTRRQKAANRRIARHRVRIEHVNSRVKRCRMVHDTCQAPEGGVAT